MPSWIQDPITGELIPKDKYQREASSCFITAFKDFISPIDGTRIANSKQLAEHNKKHGVTNINDYGPDWFKRKKAEREHILRGDSPTTKNERISTILESIAKHEGR